MSERIIVTGTVQNRKVRRNNLRLARAGAQAKALRAKQEAEAAARRKQQAAAAETIPEETETP